MLKWENRDFHGGMILIMDYGLVIDWCGKSMGDKLDED
jgi:hypothetical protein